MNPFLNKHLRLLLLFILLLLMIGCTPNTQIQSGEPESTSIQEAENMELVLDHEEEIEYAENFTLTHYQGGFKMFTVSSAPDKQFLLVPEGKEIPQNLDDNVVVLRKPINRIHMVSTAAAALTDAIGGLDNIVSTGTPAEQWYVDGVKERVESGKIQFAGKHSEPDFEMLTELNVNLEIDSTMLQSHPEIIQKYEELGIPVIIDSASLESHPLGKVEWIKWIGALIDKENEAKTFFDNACKKVDEISKREKTGLKVASFRIITSSKEISVRNGGDYMVKMMEFAGGEYMLKDLNPDQSGLERISFEEAYTKCKDADVVFCLNSYGGEFENMEDLFAINDLFKDFKAVQNDRFYLSSPSLFQDIVNVADMISDMNAVLTDENLEGTRTLMKLKK